MIPRLCIIAQSYHSGDYATSYRNIAMTKCLIAHALCMSWRNNWKSPGLVFSMSNCGGEGVLKQQGKWKGDRDSYWASSPCTSQTTAQSARNQEDISEDNLDVTHVCQGPRSKRQNLLTQEPDWPRHRYVIQHIKIISFCMMLVSLWLTECYHPL